MQDRMKLYRTPNHDPEGKQGPQSSEPQGQEQADLGNAAAQEALPDQTVEPSVLDGLAAEVDEEKSRGAERGAKRAGGRKKKRKKEPAVLELSSPVEGTGSGTLATSTGLDAVAKDMGSYTKVFLRLKKNNPDKSDDELLDMLAKRRVNRGSQTAHLGDRHTKKDGKKEALIIGNEDYLEEKDLPGAKSDAAGMASTYKAAGFEVDHQVDLEGKKMDTMIQAAGKDLKEGDELLVYYAGHGVRQGLLGIDSPHGDPLVEETTVAGKVPEAKAGGYHATVMIDACHAGGTIDELQEQGETKPPETEVKDAEKAKP